MNRMQKIVTITLILILGSFGVLAVAHEDSGGKSADMLKSSEPNLTVTQIPDENGTKTDIPRDDYNHDSSIHPGNHPSVPSYINVLVFENGVVNVFEDIDRSSIELGEPVSVVDNGIGLIKTTYRIFEGSDEEETSVQIWSRWNGDDQPKLDEPQLLEVGTGTYDGSGQEIMKPLIVSSRMIFEDPDKRGAVYVVADLGDEYSIRHLTDFLIVPVKTK